MWQTGNAYRAQLFAGCGSSHTVGARSAFNRATALARLAGQLPEAIALGEAVLQLQRTKPDADRLAIAASMNNLGVWYAKAGRRREALQMATEVRGGCHRQRGSMVTPMKRVNVATSVEVILDSVANMDALWARQAVKIREELLGPQHPKTVQARSNMTNRLCELGERQQTADSTRANMEVQRGALGEDHPSILTCMSNLAVALHDLGEVQEATAMARKAWKARERVLGREHPDTLASLSNLATDLADCGCVQVCMYPAWILCMRRVYAHRPAKPSKCISWVRQSRHDPASVQRGGGSSSRLRRLHCIHHVRTGTLGPSATPRPCSDELSRSAGIACCSRTLCLGVSLSYLLQLRAHRLFGGKQEAAEKAALVLAHNQRMHGKDHELTVITAENLAIRLGEQGRHQAASALLRQACPGDDLQRTPMTSNSCHKLA